MTFVLSWVNRRSLTAAWEVEVVAERARVCDPRVVGAASHSSRLSQASLLAVEHSLHLAPRGFSSDFHPFP